VPLFSGGAVDSRTRQAAAQRDAARDELESRRRRLARETLDHHRSVIAGIGQIEAARIALESAGKALESTRVGLELGTQTMTDLLLAIQTLSAAQELQSQARHRYIVSRLLLAQDAGAIGEADLTAVNAMLQ
jgi:outer membrane protein